MPFYYKPKSLDEILVEGQGLISENAPRLETNGTQQGTSGTVYASLVPLRAGMVVTNIHLAVGATAAGTVTTIKAGLYDKSGNRLALSANSTTAFDSINSIATLAMGSAYSVPSTDVYYAAVIVVATTMPALLRIASQTPFQVAIGSGAALAAAEAGQTDLDATATLAANPVAYWFGIS